jgi:predicted ATPase/DNA-binding SARP family transcriptional activator
MEFRVLGPLDVVAGGQELKPPGGKPGALLGMLLLEPGRVVPVDRIVDALWGAQPPSTATKVLQGYVSRLRKVVGDECLQTTANGYLLRVEAGSLDVRQFEALLDRGRSLVMSGPSGEAVTVLENALGLWRGPALVDFRDEAFAQNEIGRLEELRLVAVELLLEARLALGHSAEAVGELEALVRSHPLRESLRGLLMLALYRSGRQADALSAYQDARSVLVEELGLEPSRSLQQLEQAILRHDESLDVEARVATMAARVELGNGTRRQSWTVANLPRPASSFIGREREVAEVVDLFGDRGARLVTLTGPGGTGKTRLAIEAALAMVGEFATDVVWVGLAAVRDPALVVETIAQTLGAKTTLADYVGERELLLLLDNFEQVIEASPQLAALLRACPKLSLLVTSRELLRVEGETAYRVPTLDEREAVELFCARAQVRASAAVAELCSRLDNLPLAVELAAARMSVLSLEQILDRISQRLDLFRGGRDSDARQRTLRATILWSYELLSTSEQDLFARLSVFAGGFDLAAAEEVCMATIDSLGALVDKNLLRHTGERFRMLETIHEFAVERLEESAEAQELQRRHAHYFLELFERHDEERREQRETLSEYVVLVKGEQTNARRALAWFRARGNPEELARIVTVTGPLWMASPTEGRRLLESALAIGDLPAEVRARLLWMAGRVMSNQGDQVAYRRVLEEEIPLSKRLGDHRSTAFALRALGGLALREREFAKAHALFEESTHIAAELDDRELLAQVATSEAHIPLYQGDLEQAERAFEKALGLARETGLPELVKSALSNLGFVLLEQERFNEAASLYGQSLAIRVELSRTFWELAVEGLAAVAVRHADAPTAARLLGATTEWQEKPGSTLTKPRRPSRTGPSRPLETFLARRPTPCGQRTEPHSNPTRPSNSRSQSRRLCPSSQPDPRRPEAQAGARGSRRAASGPVLLPARDRDLAGKRGDPRT